MTPQLPEELLIPILEHLTPTLALDRPAHLEAVRALAACCTASKQLCRLAQPLLWRCVSLQTEQDVEPSFLDRLCGDEGRLVRSIRTSGAATTILRRRGMAEAFKAMSNVEELELAGLQRLHFLVPFSTLSNLRYLCISKSQQRLPGFIPPFPTLTTLSLHGVFFIPSTLSAFLTPVNLPSLRVFHLGAIFDPQTSDAYVPDLAPALLAQLDFVQLHTRAYSRLERASSVDAYLRGSTPLLVSYTHPDELRTLERQTRLAPAEWAPLHLQVWLILPLAPGRRTSHSDSAVAKAISPQNYAIYLLRHLIEQLYVPGGPRIASIWLDPSLQSLFKSEGPSSVDMYGVMSAVYELEGCARAQGVELRYFREEDLGDGEEIFPPTSSAFWEYAQGLKARGA
ncbi:hypothetical protein JCM10207_003689 [Rhodosporidiobolus poonsookiae]